MTSVIFLPAPDSPAELAQLAQLAPDGGPIAVYRAPAREEIPAPVPAVPRQAPANGVEAPAQPASAAAAAAWSSDPADDARVRAICQSVALAALEVLGGVRPLQQMSRWLDQENYDRLQLRANLVRGRRQAAAAAAGSGSGPDPQLLHRGVRIRSCRLCPVAEGIYEGAVVALEHERARAVALRIQLRRGLWRVTALEIG
ncbi:Rv3235 family protein [Arthrobacter zhangbolii]|uniref:Rv3235 family protein n=1 Tax=Arthrobacter zhangbolii TaxID=2886936 RepID=A0A9X1MBV3_9MICC|nr:MULTISPECIES: Rv3235 family protein [Arthrobacter]MCC3274009.1 Rv3235 family protein [Arthrobacter zhangbolii]MDN3903975.1 Rv3235 family protein [Arthrobacter sp. YD2]UON91262.1 Rv3235 family protein [Arthrobacter zhangbolii]